MNKYHNISTGKYLHKLVRFYSEKRSCTISSFQDYKSSSTFSLISTACLSCFYHSCSANTPSFKLTVIQIHLQVFILPTGITHPMSPSQIMFLNVFFHTNSSTPLQGDINFHMHNPCDYLPLQLLTFSIKKLFTFTSM